MDQNRADAASAGLHGDASADKRKSSGGTVRITRRKDEPDAPDKVEILLCPVCHLKNPANEVYCADCGFLLLSGFETEGVPALLSAVISSPCLEDNTGHFFPLHPGINTLGRENADILLIDRSVSRAHGIIVFDEDREIYSVQDSGSTNGSRLNGELLAANNPRPIRPGDNLTFGNIQLRFVAEGAGQIAGMAAENLDDAQRRIEPTLPILGEAAVTDSEPIGRLALLHGSAPREVLLGHGITTIGRNADNRVCLTDDRYISGHHARIEADGSSFLLIDVGSTNGTFLNGLRLPTNTSLAINDGDEITLGSLVYQFNKMIYPSASSAPERTLTVGDDPPGRP